MAVKKLLDENSLLAVKTYVDTFGGKVDDVQVNSTSVISNKIANIAVDGTYNASTNKIASLSSITNAINALDVSNITGFGAGKTLATLVETNGKISATFQDISITESQISDFGSYVPTTRTIAGLGLSSNISSSDLVNALGLSQALTFVGASTTNPTGTSGATVSGHTTWKKGDVVLYNNLEYVNITGSNTSSSTPNPNWEELGDGASYALKTTTISAGSGLTGGGDLSANRTISHATPSGATTKTSGFYKFSTDSFGHVNGTTAVALSDLTGLGAADNSKVVHLGTSSSPSDETIYGLKTFIGASGSSQKHAATFVDTIYIASDSASTTMPLELQSKESGKGIISVGGGSGNLQVVLGVTGKIVGTLSGYGVKLPNTSGWTADKIIATLDDIPPLGEYVKGPSSSTDGNIALFDGTTGKLIKDGGTSLATVTSHISDSNIHVTSANKTSWNSKVSDVKVTEVSGQTTQDGYQKLQQSKDSGSTYTDIVACLSYNEAWAILTASN